MLSELQKQALELNSDVILKAGAGSGKTRTIIEKIIKIIKDNYNSSYEKNNVLNQILCITFTNKASDELFERIVNALNSEISNTEDINFKKYLTYILENIDQMIILTFDSFFSKILHKYAFYLGLSPAFITITEGKSKFLFRKAVFNVLDKIFDIGSNSNVDFNVIINFYAFYRKKENIFKIFNKVLDKYIYFNKNLFNFKTFDEFKQYILHRLENIKIVLINGYIELILNSYEFIEKIKILKENINLFTGKSKEKIELLIKYYEQYQNNPQKINDLIKIIVNDLNRIIYPKNINACHKMNEYFNEFKKYIKDTLEIFNLDNSTLTKLEFDFFKGFYELLNICFDEYEKLKNDLNYIDFNDIEDLMCLLVSNENICEQLKKEYQYILIDEFQDTNNRQAEIINKIKENAKLTIVGDGMQSIYRFRNANCILFSEFEKQILKNNGKAVILNENYRSKPKILNFINSFFSWLNLNNNNYFSDFNYQPLIPKQEDDNTDEPIIEIGIFHDQKNIQKDNIKINLENNFNVEPTTFINIDEQINYIANKIIELNTKKNISFSDMMILLYHMTNVDKISSILTSANIPFEIVKSRNFFQRPEILDIYNLTKTLVNPNDNVAITGLLRSPIFGIPDYIIFALLKSFKDKFNNQQNHYIFDALHYLKEEKLDFDYILNPNVSLKTYKKEKKKLIYAFNTINNLRNLISNYNAYEILSYAYDKLNLETKYLYKADYGYACDNIKKFLTHILEDDYISNAPLPVFIDNFTSIIEMEFKEEDHQKISTENSVKIMTIHQAKGLESRVVFIPELEVNFLRSFETDVLINQNDFIVEPSIFIRVNNTSLLQKYFLAIRQYELIQEFFEKKRLLYVAMTRAKDYLILSASFKNQNFSPFLQLNNYLNLLINFLKIDIKALIEKAFNENTNFYDIIDNYNNKIRIVLKSHKSTFINSQINNKNNKIDINIEDFNIIKPRNILSNKNHLNQFNTILTWSNFKNIFYKNDYNDYNFEFNKFIINLNESNNFLKEYDKIGSIFHYIIFLIINSNFTLDEVTNFTIYFCQKAINKFIQSNINLSSELTFQINEWIIDFLRKAKNDKILNYVLGYNKDIKKYSEISFKRIINHITLSGTCDLMIIDNLNLTICDFKVISYLNQNLKFNLRDYKKQLAFYSLCIEDKLINNIPFNNFQVKYLIILIELNLENKVNIKIHDVPIQQINTFKSKIIDYVLHVPQDKILLTFEDQFVH